MKNIINIIKKAWLSLGSTTMRALVALMVVVVVATLAKSVAILSGAPASIAGALQMGMLIATIIIAAIVAAKCGWKDGLAFLATPVGIAAYRGNTISSIVTIVGMATAAAMITDISFLEMFYKDPLGGLLMFLIGVILAGGVTAIIAIAGWLARTNRENNPWLAPTMVIFMVGATALLIAESIPSSHKVARNNVVVMQQAHGNPSKAADNTDVSEQLEEPAVATMVWSLKTNEAGCDEARNYLVEASNETEKFDAASWLVRNCDEGRTPANLRAFLVGLEPDERYGELDDEEITLYGDLLKSLADLQAHKAKFGNGKVKEAAVKFGFAVRAARRIAEDRALMTKLSLDDSESVLAILAAAVDVKPEYQDTVNLISGIK